MAAPALAFTAFVFAGIVLTMADLLGAVDGAFRPSAVGLSRRSAP